MGKETIRDSDFVYWTRRAREERERAEIPADPATIAAHRMFALSYEARLRGRTSCDCKVSNELTGELP